MKNNIELVVSYMIGVEKPIFSEAYIILEKYYDYPNTDETWEKIVTELKIFGENYEGHPMAKQMIDVVMQGLEYSIANKYVDEKYRGRRAKDWGYLVERYKYRKQLERARNYERGKR